MKKILIFDDRPQIRDFLRSSLESETTELLIYSRVYDVNEYFENNGINIDGIILDIIMPSTGLKEDEKALTNGGVLTGWVWLWKHCNPNGVDEHPFKNIPVIIYTAYEADYEAYIKNIPPNSAEWAFANSKKIKLIPKKESDSNVLMQIRKHLNIN